MSSVKKTKLLTSAFKRCQSIRPKGIHRGSEDSNKTREKAPTWSAKQTATGKFSDAL